MGFGDMGLALTDSFLAKGIRGVACLSLALGVLPVAGVAAADRGAAGLLPADTPTAVFVSADPQDWAGLEGFELFAKVADFVGLMGGEAEAGLGNPASILFAVPGANYESEVAPWVGEQVAIATLPDITPRSIALTDLAEQTFIVVPVADETALDPFIEKLEASRPDEVLEKSTYKGAELWVWPTREVSLYGDEAWDEDDYDENWQDLPEVPHEEIEDLRRSGVQVELDAVSAQINAMPDEGLSLPRPGDFETEGGYDTYEVKGRAVAQVDGYLIFAQEPETLKTLLDYREFDYPRLGDSELFLRSGYGDVEGAIARIYSNLSEVSKFNLDGGLFQGARPSLPNLPGLPELPGLPQFPTNVPALVMPQETQALIARALEGMTLDGLIYPQAEGIRMQGRVYGNNLVRSNATPELPYADSALRFVPAPAYSLNSGRNIAGLWRQIASRLSLNETTRGYLDQARTTISFVTGLDLDTELLGWMDREFVLFFFPSRSGAFNSFSPGVGVEMGVALQTSDRPTAQKVFDTLDGLATEFAQPITINDAPAVSWQVTTASDDKTTEQTTSYLSHSWLAEDTIVITSGAGAMAQLLNNSAFEPVAEHPTFINATAPLEKPNNGYSYLNAGSTFSMAYALVSKWLQVPPDNLFFQQVKSYLGTIRGGGSTTSSTDEYWQLDAILNLAPAEERESLEP